MTKVQSKILAQTLHEMVDGKSNQQAHAIVKKFVEYLASRGILSQGKEVATQYAKVSDQSEGIVTAKVISSTEVSDAQISKIKSYLKKKYNYEKVEVELEEDSSIGKGLKVMVDDLVLDMTLDSRVNRLREYLIKKI